MTIALIRGNALTLPLAASSVDLIITSPPYFGLRSYTDDGQHYAGQIGSEATPGEFLDALVAATAEMVRVLKPSGSIWVNLGDKYSQSANQWGGSRRGHQGVLAGGRADSASRFGVAAAAGAPDMGRPKSLMGLPWRYAIRCIDELGLILRAEVIWSKPNGLPESVTDRVRRSHEQWFHFTKEPRYYSAVDEIREASDPRNAAHAARYNEAAKTYGKVNNDRGDKGAGLFIHNPLGKLPGSVWSVPTQPLTVPPELGVDHFAAFPMEWPRRIIKGWSPSGICTACGEGRRPVTEVLRHPRRPSVHSEYPTHHGGHATRTLDTIPEATITGESCACLDSSAPTRPAVVLDPFGGTGTVAMVADALGRHGISVDMSGDYCRLARWRTTDPGQRATAHQVDKPPPAPQTETLFG